MEERGWILSWSESGGRKSNEITAIPELLEKLQIKGQNVTIDAMGTQKGIAEKMRSKRADYVLAVKGNQEVIKRRRKRCMDG